MTRGFAALLVRNRQQFFNSLLSRGGKPIGGTDTLSENLEALGKAKDGKYLASAVETILAI
jgi:hypothetical protein